MVSAKLIAIVALIACVIAVGTVLYTSLSFDAGIVEYPESEMVSVEDMRYMKANLNDFRVVCSYHFKKIEEGAEFKVEVSDVNTGVAIEGANISFMIPLIHSDTNKEGFVYFSAPKIQDEYLLHPNDTCRAFPLTVKKEGYNTYTTSVTVHLRE